MTSTDHHGTLDFRIKICGVTRAEDVDPMLDWGAEAIGLNFYSRSARYVTDDVAIELAGRCRGRLQRVGVFVNESAAEIRRRVSEVGLEWVQLHGDEPPAAIAELAGLRVIRAFRVGSAGLGPVTEYLAACGQLGTLPQAVLLDAAAGNQYGGTGQALDWSPLRQVTATLAGLPWIVAGGLTADNVGAAIEATDAAGVDTASGVESSPGRKDAVKLRAFIVAAQRAFSTRR